MRMEVLDRVRGIAVKKWPNVTVRAFGSVHLDLYLPTSDVDIVMMGNWSLPPVLALEALAAELYTADIACEHSLTLLDKAKVPIVKFIDKETQLKINIRVNEMSCIAREVVMKELKAQYPCLSILFLVIKQLLTVRQLDETTRGIHSYSLVLMLIELFQKHSYQNVTIVNFGALLIQFLDFYGRDFDFKKLGISLNEGGYYFPRKDAQFGRLYISDPLNPKVNGCKGCYGFVRVKECFKDAFHRVHTTMACQDTPTPMCSTLLGEILRIPLEVEEYREWVKNTWCPGRHVQIQPRGASSSQQS